MQMVEGIRRNINISRVYNEAYAVQWHDHAQRLLVDECDEQRINTYIEQSVSMLRDYPYDELVEASSTSRKSAESMTEMRFLRKALMIGRDTFNLVNERNLYEEPELQHIPALATLAGRVADTHGKKQFRKDMPDAAISAQAAAKRLEGDMLQPVSLDTFRERCQHKLAAAALASIPAGQLLNHSAEEYHDARRTFRSIAHLAIMNQVLWPSDEHEQLMKQGIEVNKHFGDKHDLLVAFESNQIATVVRSYIA